MKFTIDELTITLHGLTVEPGASSAHPLHALMRAILTAVPADPEGGDDAPASPTGNGTTPEAATSGEAPATSAPREFKVGDRVRIAASVDEDEYESSDGPGFVAKMRDHLGMVGVVVSARSPDRVRVLVDSGSSWAYAWLIGDLTLVQPDAAPSADTPAPPAMTDDAILAFLRSDARYRYRTAAAVAKHFDVPERVAYDHLESLCTEGDVKFVTRRDDGARLYCAI